MVYPLFIKNQGLREKRIDIKSGTTSGGKKDKDIRTFQNNHSITVKERQEITPNPHTLRKTVNRSTYCETLNTDMDRKHWTILLYLNGDDWSVSKRQEEDFLHEFDDVARRGSTPNVSIVCQLDRYKGGTSTYGDWTGTKRFYIEQGMTPTPENAIQDLGEKNMGSPQVLKNFLRWAITNFPADNYLLAVLVREDYPDTDPVFTGEDSLKVSEFTKALREIKGETGASLGVVLPYRIGLDEYYLTFYPTAVTYGLEEVVKSIVLPGHNTYDTHNTYFMEEIVKNITKTPTRGPVKTARAIADIQFRQTSATARWVSALNISAYSRKAIPFLDDLARTMLRKEYYQNDSALKEAFAKSVKCYGSHDTIDLLNLSREIQQHKNSSADTYKFAVKLEEALMESRVYYAEGRQTCFSGILIQLDSGANPVITNDWGEIHQMRLGRNTFWDEFWKMKVGEEIAWVHNLTLYKTIDSSYVNLTLDVDTSVDMNLTLKLFGVSNEGELTLREGTMSVRGNNESDASDGLWTCCFLRFPYKAKWNLRLEIYEEGGKNHNMVSAEALFRGHLLKNITYTPVGYPTIKIDAPKAGEVVTDEVLTIHFRANVSSDYSIYSRIDGGEWNDHGTKTGTVTADISSRWDWNAYNKTHHSIQLKIASNGKTIHSLTVSIRVDNNKNKILIVANNNVGEFLVRGLRDLGFGEKYKYMKTYNETHYNLPSLFPSSERMSQYDVVFWLGGVEGTLRLSSFQQKEIANYLENDGKLAMTGSNIAKNCNSSNSTFLQKYLKVTYHGEGVNSTPFTEDYSLFWGLKPASNGWNENIVPIGGARYTVKFNSYGGGIQYCNKYRLVFTTKMADAIGFEGESYVSRTLDFLNTSKPEFLMYAPKSGQAYFNYTEIQMNGSVFDTDYNNTRMYIDGTVWGDLNNPWEFVQNFSVEKTYLVKFDTWDWIGHHSIYRINVTIDLTSPTLCICSPSETKNISAKLLNVTWEGKDPNLCLYSYHEEGERWTNTTSTWHVFSPLSEGVHTFYVKVYDKAGNSEVASKTVTIDTLKPEVLWVTKNESISNLTEVSVTWNASDNGTGLKVCKFRLNEGGWNNSTTSHTTFLNLPEGRHNVSLWVYDWAGNVNKSVLLFWVDLSPPSFTVSSKQAGKSLSYNEVCIEWEVNDSNGVETIQYRIDTGTWYNVSPLLGAVNLSIPEGEHTVQLKAFDKVGKFNSSSVCFTIDTTRPVIVIVNQNNSYYNYKNVTIEWIGSDNGTGINTSYIRANQEAWIWVSSSGNHTIILPEGTHVIQLSMLDAVGNNRTVSLYLTVDITTPSLVITTPEVEEDPYWSRKLVEITYEADDIHFNKTALYLNGSMHEEYAAKGLNEIVQELSEGAYDVWLVAIDRAGNENKSRKMTIIVDMTYPEIEIDLPHFTNSSQVTVKWNYTDNFMVNTCQLRREGEEWIDVPPSGTFTFTFSEANHTVFFKVTDMVNHRVIVSSETTVDLTPPHLTILTPTFGEWCTRTYLEIEWRGEDEFLSHFEIRVNEGRWTNIGVREVKNITGLSTGCHMIDLQAVDKAGNIRKDSVSINVDMDAPWVGIETPEKPVTLKNFNVTWSAADLMGIKFIEIFLNESLNRTYYNESVRKHTFKGVPTGVWAIKVVVCDYVNHTACDLVEIEVRSISISIENLEDRYFTAEKVIDLQWCVEGRGLERVEVYVSEKKVATLSWTNLSCRVNLGKNASDGNYLVMVRLFDRYGNFVETDVVICLDTKAPEIKVTRPSNNTFTNDNLNFTWEGEDIFLTEFYVNSSLVASVKTNHYRINLVAGANMIQLVAKDRAGNRANSSLIVVYLDTHSPTVIILQPSNNTVLDGATKGITVTWQGEDNYYVANISVFLDDAFCESYEGGNGSHFFSDFTPGQHTIVLIAVDGAGNSNATRIRISLDKSRSSSFNIGKVNENAVIILLSTLGFTFASKGVGKLLKRWKK